MATPFDPFTLTSLTASINAIPYTPQRLGQLGLFREQGTQFTTAQIELLNGSLNIISTAPRGGSGQTVLANKRKKVTLEIPHIPTVGGIDADELQNVRMFGTEAQPDQPSMAMQRLTLQLRSALELTIEAHRVGALKGVVLDADGSPLLDLFSAFGVTQQTVGMALTTASTKVRTKVGDALMMMEDALGGTAFGGVRVLCGSVFFAELASHANVEKFYLNSPAAQSLAGNPLQAFEFGGATFERYRGVAGCRIEDDDAYMVPLGVAGLFETRFAPANYTETVNTLGLPMYAKAEPRDFGKGWDIEAQTNPLNICTRPNAVIKLTKV